MVNCAIHNRFASLAQSPRAPDAESGHRDGQPAWLVAAAAQAGATLLLSDWYSGRPRSVWSAESVALYPSQCALDNDNIAPRPDASAASSTSAAAPGCCAQPP